MNARVLLVASEAVPLVKTGGLADVITSLAATLREHGSEATILLPAYPGVAEGAGPLHEVGRLPDLPGGSGVLLQGCIPDSSVPVVLLKTAGFDRRSANPYVDVDGSEYTDNALCFAALAQAAAEICAGNTQLARPHVVHANDWHAALIPTYLKLKGIRDVGTVLTIHNLAFQGNYPLDVAPALGIPPEMLGPDGLEFWGQLSFLKAGILHADRITTVSHSYAREILTPRFGHGMEGILNARKQDLLAIANGVDTETWNPATDELIARRFTPDDLRGKSACKRELQQMFGLPVDPFAPILAMGSRITHQKMADVALAALPHILNRHPRAQLVVLGRGDRAYEQGLFELAGQFPSRIGLFIGYDEHRAHALHAGADMLLHGTRFEPFGLTPLYSMRYGTIPIASRVGGMIDSIPDAGLKGAVPNGACGVLFDGEEAADMAGAVSRAFELHAAPRSWHTMQCNAMSVDFSWDGPAEQYINAYAAVAAPSAKSLFVAARKPATPPTAAAVSPATVPVRELQPALQFMTV
ncbi:starch synthase [Paucimonas lemoignei]|uniref:Glycogen synthase n=1 Tax=Paucimonas lemoignei TaxID=29443 RepID=A0A4R3I3I1_PAULE|nr:glycogen synthase GlgA [Paucimonas lemoignei]TCS39381.1 starch synthase [Paucimonas lemoignei]